MAGRIHAFDWTTSPLGSIEGWPQSLRTAVDMMLAMPGPATILWGSAHVQFYNDAYIAIAQDRHPALLGRPAAENWPEAYEEVIAPLLAEARAGRGTQLTDFPVPLREPHGRIEERVFDTDWSPIRDESGAVAGALQTLTEVTERHRAQASLRASEERQAFLLGLSDALRPLIDAAEIQATTTRMLGEHLKVDRAMYAEVYGEPGAEMGIIRGQYVRPWHDGEPPLFPFPERFTYESYGARTMAARYRGEPLVVCDVLDDPAFNGADRDAWTVAGVHAAVVATLAKGGRLVAELGVHCTGPRSWTEAEVALVEEVAERTWAAAERARAETALRESEEKYRMLFASIDEGYLLSEVVYDADGRPIDLEYIETNPAAIRLAGRDFTGQRLRRIDPGYEQYWIDLHADVARTGRPARDVCYAGPHDRWFDFHISRFGGDGSRRLATVFQDVTDRKRMEQALRETAERQAFLLALGDTMRAESTADGKIAVAARLLGEKLDASRVLYAEYDHEKGLAYIFNGWLADGAQPFPPVLKLEDFEGEVLNDLREGRIVRVDDVGRLRAESGYAAIANVGVQALLSPTLLVDGKLKFNVSIHQHGPRHWSDDEVALVQDVSERLWAEIVRARAEAALRDSEEKYRGLFESIDEGFCIIELIYDEAGNPCDALHLEANPAHARHSGVANVVGTRMLDFIPAEEARDWLAFYDQVARTGRDDRMESEMPAIDRWVAVFASRVGGTGSARVAVVFNDISERKRAEAELRASEERQAFLLMLSDRLRVETDPRAIAEISIGLLADHLRLDRAYVAQVDKHRDVAEVGPEFRRPDLTPVPGAFTLSDFPEAFAQVEATTLALTDTAADPMLSDRDRAGFAALRMGALIVASARKGTHNPVWALLVASEEPRQWTAAEVALVEETAERTWTTIERARGEAALRESEGRLRALMEGIPQLVWRASEQGLWTWSSPQWRDFTGQTPEESHGLGWLDAVHPADRDATMRAWEAARPHGTLNAEYRLRRASDGVYLWHHTRSMPVRDEGGRISEWLGTSTDVHALREMRERQNVLVAELQHRTRNLIGVVSALSRQTLKNSTSLSDFGQHFADRLAALSRVQGLLSNLSAGERVTFDDLLVSELKALGAAEDKLTLDGPPGVPLRSATVQTFSLALHELATNALKYGALAAPRGRLTVRWGVARSDGDGPRLQVDWRESGVVMTQVGERARGGGYGRELIERALPYQLDAETTYEMTGDGVHCTIDVPASTAAAELG